MTRESEIKKKKTRAQAAGKTGGGAEIPAGTGVACARCGADNLSGSRFCQQCASPLGEASSSASSIKTIKAQTSEISRGAILAGRYEILEELGTGGMGKVFKVSDRTISETVALKLIRPEIGAQEKAVERFKNELKFTRKITHRNICRMYDLGKEGYNFYITMEYVPGEDLKSFVKRAGPLNPGKAVSIAKQVCEGLAEAHRVGAIHRDLKPQNIMIDREGNAKIMDFGIARFMELDRMTGSGVMIGTPEYMSPEQAELIDIDKRADIYSLGIVLFEMLTGKVPFEGGTALSLAMKHKLEKPKNVRELNAQLTVGLADIVAKCLEKDRENRYQSVEALSEALSEAEREIATGEWVVPKGRPKRAATSQIKKTSPASPNKIRLAGIGGAAILILALLGFLFLRPVGEKKAGGNRDPRQAGGVSTETKKTSAPISVEKQETKTVAQAAPRGGQSSIPPAVSSTRPATSAPGSPSMSSGAIPRIESASLSASATDVAAVNLARARTAGPKAYAIKFGLDKSAFFHLASLREAEASSWLGQKRTTDARCLFTIVEGLYRLCLDRSTDAEKLKGLKRFTADLRNAAGKEAKTSDLMDLFAQGREAEKRGESVESAKDIEGAARNFSQASFLYEKVRWIARLTDRK